MSLELSIVSLGSPCPFPFTDISFTIFFNFYYCLANKYIAVQLLCCFAACYLIRSSNQN